MPKVSVIMSVYNGEEFLRDSILSILNQTYSDFEFVIIDDCSTDNTLKILEEFYKKDSRIKILNNTQNLGLTKSLNKAISESSGEYLARLDAGDVSSPDRLEKQVAFLDQHKEVGLLGSFMYIIDTKGEILKEVRYPTDNETLKKDLIKYNPFVHSSIMFRKDVGARVGFYDENFKYAQDYDFYFKLFPLTKFANLPMFLVQYRHMPNSITSTKNKQQMKYANKARKYAILLGYYSSINYIYVFKNYLVSLIPTKVKFFIKKFI